MWVLLTLTIFGFGFMSVSQYYESIMSESYNMIPEDVTVAEGVFPIVYAIILMIAGFAGDLLGRKKLILIYSIITVISMIMFNVSSYLAFSPIIIGIFMSLSRSAYYTAYDYISMMVAEKSPTSNRSSVVGAVSLVSNLGTGIGYGLIMVLLLLISTKAIGVTCILVATPPIIVAMIIMMLKVKETKGTDLEKVGEEQAYIEKEKLEEEKIEIDVK